MTTEMNQNNPFMSVMKKKYQVPKAVIVDVEIQHLICYSDFDAGSRRSTFSFSDDKESEE